MKKDTRIKKKKREQKIIVVSGSTGFIGTNLVKRLLADGHQVAGIPRDMLNNYELLEKWLSEIKPDYIFHLSAYGNHHTQTDADEMFVANVIQTYNLLRATAPLDYEAFINFSSSSVYGKKPTAMKESMCLDTASLYGCTKVAGEYLARAFSYELDKPIVNIRPFSVFGEMEASHRFIPTVIDHLLNDRTLDLYPEPVHDWIYIQDFIDGLLTVVDNIEDVKGASVNIGTGRQLTNKYIVDTLCEVTKKNVKLNLLEGGRENDLTMWKADIERIKSLGWHPKHTIETALRYTYDYYKNNPVLENGETSLEDAVTKSLEMLNPTNNLK